MFQVWCGYQRTMVWCQVTTWWFGSTSAPAHFVCGTGVTRWFTVGGGTGLSVRHTQTFERIFWLYNKLFTKLISLGILLARGLSSFFSLRVVGWCHGTGGLVGDNYNLWSGFGSFGNILLVSRYEMSSHHFVLCSQMKRDCTDCCESFRDSRSFRC